MALYHGHFLSHTHQASWGMAFAHFISWTIYALNQYVTVHRAGTVGLAKYTTPKQASPCNIWNFVLSYGLELSALDSGSMGTGSGAVVYLVTTFDRFWPFRPTEIAVGKPGPIESVTRHDFMSNLSRKYDWCIWIYQLKLYILNWK